GDITQYLALARAGDHAALDEVFHRVYDEIHRIADHQVGRISGEQTLTATAIIHEAYLKLMRTPDIAWDDRAHFFAVAATAMRQILLNRARARLTEKRGGGRPLSLTDQDAPIDTRAEEMVALDQALDQLSVFDARLARVVELRYFGGLSVEEAARVLGVADRTVKRDWQLARAFLFQRLRGAARD
ncbi:MAG: sigma-70 family RNA polymerase sigma factor, partial [Candidatus Eisenbacteria bacterium]|nr:sigma-70 family RNA polymerase sigma factor [Candidatus Eisenbacteria bacterium]